MISAHRVSGLAAVTVLTGSGFVACDGKIVGTNVAFADAGSADGADARAPAAPPPVNCVRETLPEEKTVGKPCVTSSDCEVQCSVGDNVCSNTFFDGGDFYSNPVCVSPCKRGPGQTFADVLCDGDDPQTSPGLCDARNPGETGHCLPSCKLGSTTIDIPCTGGSKCLPKFFGTVQSGEALALGVCWGDCRQDSDCKGTAGSKCQTELGVCVDPAAYVTYPKAPSESCNRDLAECNCIAATASTGTITDLGYCTLACVTGAEGDAHCEAVVPGWKCSAALPSEFTNPTRPAFTGQPDGILGTCRKPCTVASDCDALAATIGVAMACDSTAGLHTCAAAP